MNKIDLEHGKHTLTAISDGIYTIESWHEEEVNCIAVVIDGKLYGVYEDPDDGFRSYCVFAPLDPAKFEGTFILIPNEEVYIYQKEIREMHEYEEVHMNTTVIKALDGKTILECGTDYTDSYYPYGYHRYYPENMACNR